MKVLSKLNFERLLSKNYTSAHVWLPEWGFVSFVPRRILLTSTPRYVFRRMCIRFVQKFRSEKGT